VRLAKHIAAGGVASRRAAEDLIRAGRVAVDGVTERDPARGVTDGQAVTVDGSLVSISTERVVYALHKPAGVVSTARDPQGRPTVVSLVPSDRRLYPIGRLDIDTTGLILLTNDGELAHRLTHPRFEVPKTYRAEVGGPPVSERVVRQLSAGVQLEDVVSAPAEVRRIRANTLELTIHEGRKRQVRRMCEAVGHPVKRLTRIRFGPLELGGLRAGAYRRLTEPEIRALSSAGSGARPAAAS
jgi:23S rRNA pseudouridine2605 synthase